MFKVFIEYLSYFTLHEDLDIVDHMGKCTARRLSLFENLKIEVLIINRAAIQRGFIPLYWDLLQLVL